MANVDDIVSYYADLLIIQYHNKPKAKAMIELFAREVLASGIMFDVRDGYDLETAVGVQLDVIGKYVGVDRFYTGQVLDNYFSFIDYDEVTSPPAGRIGYSIYSTFETKVGRFLTYYGVLSSGLVLSDDDFRFLIKLKIIQNNSNHSHKSIDDSIFAFFGDTVRPDSGGNMIMDYFVDVNAAAIVGVAIQKKILPKPAGVRLNYVIEETSTFFGFISYDTTPVFNTGFTDYTGYDTKVGETLNYSKLIS